MEIQSPTLTVTQLSLEDYCSRKVALISGNFLVK
jgi:hypothetical protein